MADNIIKTERDYERDLQDLTSEFQKFCADKFAGVSTISEGIITSVFDQIKGILEDRGYDVTGIDILTKVQLEDTLRKKLLAEFAKRGIETANIRSENPKQQLEAELGQEQAAGYDWQVTASIIHPDLDVRGLPIDHPIRQRLEEEEKRNAAKSNPEARPELAFKFQLQPKQKLASKLGMPGPAHKAKAEFRVTAAPKLTM